MAITLELAPDAEARLRSLAEQQGLEVGEYVAALVSEPRSNPFPGCTETDAYLARVNAVLRRFDQLPRVASASLRDEAIRFDRWGLPER